MYLYDQEHRYIAQVEYVLTVANMCVWFNLVTSIPRRSIA